MGVESGHDRSALSQLLHQIEIVGPTSLIGRLFAPRRLTEVRGMHPLSEKACLGVHRPSRLRFDAEASYLSS